MQEIEKNIPDTDPTAVSRKHEHIALAFKSQVTQLDERFYYEPLFSAHPTEGGALQPFSFLNKTFRVPMWVSSMTGGTGLAATINRNLAQAARDFGFGMGLGSCRQLLYGDEHLADFNVRPIMGDSVALFANLGIAQLELLIKRDETWRIRRMLDILAADGLIIHVNPLQEWLQPEGDRFEMSSLAVIETILEKADYPIIVKEVGQGFGYESLKTLLKLPLAAVDFAAAGGTNFSKLELLRSNEMRQEVYEILTKVGHSATDMVEMTNKIVAEIGDERRCNEIIVSGGIKNFLDGFYCIKKLSLNAVYGQASGFLKYAQGDYAHLAAYVEAQIGGLEVAEAFLKVR